MTLPTQTEATPLVVLVTAPSMRTAQTIASKLVEERCAACVNIVPGVQSIYRWQGKIEKDAETLLIIKTQSCRLEAIQKCLETTHPDDVPECISLSISDGSESYLRWLLEQTS